MSVLPLFHITLLSFRFGSCVGRYCATVLNSITYTLYIVYLYFSLDFWTDDRGHKLDISNVIARDATTHRIFNANSLCSKLIINQRKKINSICAECATSWKSWPFLFTLKLHSQMDKMAFLPNFCTTFLITHVFAAKFQNCINEMRGIYLTWKEEAPVWYFEHLQFFCVSKCQLIQCMA